MQLLDLPREKSRKMKRRGGKCTESEVKTFKRLFIADLRVMGGKISGERDAMGKAGDWEKHTGWQF